LVDVTKKSSKAFVDSLDFIQATNLWIEDKHEKTQHEIF
jgi:hypothetical protein